MCGAQMAPTPQHACAPAPTHHLLDRFLRGNRYRRRTRGSVAFRLTPARPVPPGDANCSAVDVGTWSTSSRLEPAKSRSAATRRRLPRQPYRCPRPHRRTRALVQAVLNNCGKRCCNCNDVVAASVGGGGRGARSGQESRRFCSASFASASAGLPRLAVERRNDRPNSRQSLAARITWQMALAVRRRRDDTDLQWILQTFNARSSCFTRRWR
jgi:hypothetical protein